MKWKNSTSLNPKLNIMDYIYMLFFFISCFISTVGLGWKTWLHYVTIGGGAMQMKDKKQREDVSVGLSHHHHHHHHPLRCVCSAAAADRRTETGSFSLFTRNMASKCPKCDKTVYFGECVFFSVETIIRGEALTAGWKCQHLMKR